MLLFYFPGLGHYPAPENKCNAVFAGVVVRCPVDWWIIWVCNAPWHFTSHEHVGPGLYFVWTRFERGIIQSSRAYFSCKKKDVNPVWAWFETQAQIWFQSAREHFFCLSETWTPCEPGLNPVSNRGSTLPGTFFCINIRFEPLFEPGFKPGFKAPRHIFRL